ncbi:hypothetical protein B0T20DRAFT_489138 [Sordaria brevicollis]|uniref:Uncharacterized protein n=1 Tax=Sordaria brevicollis TaxID=83679 RepID=A0AAE0U6B2_SORBR|nr:hypothetical protein B0T20DRAFT_489138 [Sordaria brevicollis]
MSSGLDQPQNPIPDLPSWAPDFRPSELANADFSPDGKILTADTALIDYIHLTDVDKNERTGRELAEKLCRWMYFVLQHQKRNCGQASWHTQDTWTGLSEDKETSFFHHTHEEGGRPKNDKAIRNAPDVLPFTQRAARFTADKTPFITERGLIGSGSQALRPDDMVVIIRGCRIPLVIREHPDEDGSFQVVGKCCIGELMDGRIIECLLENGKLEWMSLNYR